MTAIACALAALAGCGGGGDEPRETTPPAEAPVARDPSAQRLLREAVDGYIRDKAGMVASLRTDARQGDEETLFDDLWDLRNVIYEFDQALRRIEFDPAAERRAVEILEINRVAIARIDPVLDAKDPSRAEIDAAVERALRDAEAIEERATALVARL